jgi:DNA polymerase III epsilon subunit family exonuclease
VSSKRVFIAFDVETTGLIPGVDRIVEIAGVAFRGPEVIDTFARLVDPGIPIPSSASQVNGIFDAMVRGAPPVEQALPDFLSFLGRGTAMAHNASFDVGFVSAAIDAAGLPPPEGPILDTRGLARQAFPGRFSYGLENLARDLRLDTQGAHRALADAHACRLLFQACLSALGKAGDLAVEELAALSGPALDFSSHAPRAPRAAAVLNQAIEEGAFVDISYRSAQGELTDRRIRPLSFTRIGGNIAVKAFCTLRNDERTFRLDSIVEARLADDLRSG